MIPSDNADDSPAEQPTLDSIWDAERSGIDQDWHGLASLCMKSSIFCVVAFSFSPEPRQTPCRSPLTLRYVQVNYQNTGSRRGTFVCEPPPEPTRTSGFHAEGSLESVLP